MKLRVPQSSEYDRVAMEVTGPGFLTHLEVSTELKEIERNFEVEDRLLKVKAWFITRAREPVAGSEVVLKEAELELEPEPEPEPEPELEPEPEAEEESDEETEELDAEEAEEPVVAEADELAEEPVAEVKPTRRGRRYGS